MNLQQGDRVQVKRLQIKEGQILFFPSPYGMAATQKAPEIEAVQVMGTVYNTSPDGFTVKYDQPQNGYDYQAFSWHTDHVKVITKSN